MKNYLEIINEIKANETKAKELEAKADILLKKPEISAANAISEKVAIRKSITEDDNAAAVELYTEAENIKNTNSILEENIKASFAAYVEPIIKEIMQKYAGKQYGPKTRDKIHQEAKKHNIAFYFDGRLDTYILNVYCLTDEGYKAYNMPEIEIHGTDDAGHRSNFISNTNTIQDINKIIFSSNYKYTEDPSAKKKELEAAYNEFKTFVEQAAAAEAKLNALLPDTAKRFYVVGHLSPWQKPF